MNLRVLFFCLAAWGISFTPVPAASASRPNIVFILADDLGWADVAFHGGNAPTPNLDRLVRTGLELTQHYSAATCSPTRAGLMTGRYWSRFGLLGPDNRRALPWDTVTLPRALKSVGYETALSGKWHLGSRSGEGPNHFGFDHSYGSLAGGVGPYDHFYKVGEFSRTWHRNESLITDTGHVTDLITREAVTWIAARKDAPFFLYVPFTAVHLPLKEPQRWLDQVPASITDEVARHYAASVMHLDDSVGQIVAALEKAGKRENTLLIFTSDNGGSTAGNADQSYPPDDYPKGRLPGNNAPLRGQKGDLYEGGIRVPAVMNWPGKIKPGKHVSPMQIVDWMPALCAVAGYTPERELKWDGVNVWPRLTSAMESPPRLLYWATPRGQAVRDGDMKLIVQASRPGTPPKVELFDLGRDPGETTDLAARMPDVVAKMKQKLAAISKADGDAKVTK
jgi:arylsulfatase A-like enzyme